MPLPAATHPIWQRLAAGAITKIKTQFLAIQLMTKRLEQSSASIATKAGEIYAFFVKFERILVGEIQQLASI